MTAWQNSTANRTHSKLWVSCVVLVLFALLGTSQVFAATTAAGTKITNQATVQYTPQGGTQTSQNSTSVVTYVQQVDGFSLSPNTTTINGNANDPISINYTLTNLANGTEVVQLGVANPIPQVTGYAAYLDDGTGHKTGGNLLGSNVTLAQGQVMKLILEAQFAASVTAGTYGPFQLTATDKPASIPNPWTGADAAYWNTPTAFTTQTAAVNIVVATGANVTVTKAFNKTSGTGNDTLTVTIAYKNSGLTAAPDVYFADPLNGTGFNYVPGSAKWNGVAISDSQSSMAGSGATAGQTLASYTYDTTSKFVAFHVQQVPNNSSTFVITYTVTVPSTTPGVLTNYGYFNYAEQGSTLVPAGGTATSCSNQNAALPNCNQVSATYTINATLSVALTVTGAGQQNNAQLTSSPFTTSTVANGTSVQSIYYVFHVTNTGTGNDSMTLSLSNNTFPAGTSFQYAMQSGGSPTTPLPGTALTPVSGVPGQPGTTYTTGVMAPGVSIDYLVKVDLPAGTVGGPYKFDETATSSGSATSNTTNNLTAAVVPMDLATGITTSNFGAAQGAGTIGYSAVMVNAGPVTPNGSNSYTYTLWIKNNLATADTFRLVGQVLANPGTPSFSGSDSVPAGWVLSYFYPTTADDCSSAANGAPVGNITNSINAGATLQVCAKLTPPALTAPAAAAAPWGAFFQATSTTYGSNDRVYDGLQIGTVHSVTIVAAPGQNVTPGSTVVFNNVITNNGNVAETVVLPASFLNTANTPNTTTWGINLYDGSTLLAGGATIATIAPGGTYTLSLKASPSNTANAGDISSTTITITYNTSTNTSSGANVATVIAATVTGQIDLVKMQYVVPMSSGNCNLSSFAGVTANADPTLGWSSAAIKALPGQCVAYRIAATNSTNVRVNLVRISDDINTTFTTYCDGATCNNVAKGLWITIPTGTSTPATNEATLSGNTVQSPQLDGIDPTQTAVFVFAVKIN